MIATLQRLIDREAHLAIPAARLTPRANLYELGLSAFDAVRLVVAIEREFKVEFSRETLRREAMASIEAIAKALRDAHPASATLREAA
jgi:acyl carrier protein